MIMKILINNQPINNQLHYNATIEATSNAYTVATIEIYNYDQVSSGDTVTINYNGSAYFSGTVINCCKQTSATDIKYILYAKETSTTDALSKPIKYLATSPQPLQTALVAICSQTGIIPTGAIKGDIPKGYAITGTLAEALEKLKQVSDFDHHLQSNLLFIHASITPEPPLLVNSSNAIVGNVTLSGTTATAQIVPQLVRLQQPITIDSSISSTKVQGGHFRRVISFADSYKVLSFSHFLSNHSTSISNLELLKIF